MTTVLLLIMAGVIVISVVFLFCQVFFRNHKRATLFRNSCFIGYFIAFALSVTVILIEELSSSSYVTHGEFWGGFGTLLTIMLTGFTILTHWLLHLNGRIDGLNGRIDELYKHVDDRFDKLNSRIDELYNLLPEEADKVI